MWDNLDIDKKTVLDFLAQSAEDFSAERGVDNNPIIQLFIIDMFIKKMMNEPLPDKNVHAEIMAVLEYRRVAADQTAKQWMRDQGPQVVIKLLTHMQEYESSFQKD